jgi:hypothetical protein
MAKKVTVCYIPISLLKTNQPELPTEIKEIDVSLGLDDAEQEEEVFKILNDLLEDGKIVSLKREKPYLQIWRERRKKSS